MQQCGLPGLRNQRKRLDTAKKITRESQYVKEKKKKKKKEKKERKKSKENQLAWAGKLLYIILMAVQLV